MKTMQSKGYSNFGRTMAFLPALLWSPLVLAHPGHVNGHGSWAAGFVHPFSGADHLLVMIAIGAIAAARGGVYLWRLPLTFLLGMLGGGVLAFTTGATHAGWAEHGIAASVILAGMLLASDRRAPAMAATVAIVLGAACHGFAHGAEMDPAASGVRYAIGMLMASAALHSLGILAGLLCAGRAPRGLSRASGMAVAMYGLLLLARVA